MRKYVECFCENGTSDWSFRFTAPCDAIYGKTNYRRSFYRLSVEFLLTIEGVFANCQFFFSGIR